jgi:hypothetical protein
LPQMVRNLVPLTSFLALPHRSKKNKRENVRRRVGFHALLTAMGLERAGHPPKPNTERQTWESGKRTCNRQERRGWRSRRLKDLPSAHGALESEQRRRGQRHKALTCRCSRPACRRKKG